VKFALGLGLVAASYLVMAVVAVPAAEAPVSPVWLLLVFLLQAAGELALAPVGISAAGTAAPAFYRSQMMGLWWLSAAVGAAVGGRIGQLAPSLPQPPYYAALAVVALAVGLVLVARRVRIGRLLTAGVPAA
jgi:POT family proton-dependent oligopeptide transporter